MTAPAPWRSARFHRVWNGVLLVGSLLAAHAACAQPAATAGNWHRQWNSGDTETALALGERVVAATDEPPWSVTYRAQLSQHYRVVGKLARAQELVDDAAVWADKWRFRMINDGGASGYWRRLAEFELARARCLLSISMRSPDEAGAHCDTSLAKARRLAELAGFGEGTSEAAGHEVQALLDQARLALNTGRLPMARTLVEQAGRVVEAHRVGGNQQINYLRAAASLAAENGDAERAVSLAEQAVAAVRSSGSAPGSVRLMQARAALHEVHVRVGDWKAAEMELDSIQAALRGQGSVRLRPNLLAESLTLGHAGRLEELAARLDNGAANWRDRLGDAHPQTLLLKGLHGAALAAQAAKDGDTGGETLARARRQLADASAGLMEAQRQRDPALDGAMESLAARYVLEQFLRAQRTGTPAPGEFQMAFQAADVLRGSKVQAAMQEATLRTARGSAGLTDLLNRDTDARNGLRRLEEQLAGRTDGGAEKLRAQVTAFKQERESVAAQIRSRYPALSAVMNPRTPTPQDVVNRLAVTELFVLLLPTADGVHVWSLSWKDQRHHFVPLPEAELNREVQALRDSTDFGTRLPPFALAAARNLGARLLEPLQDAIRQVRHVVVAAGGTLGSVPFAALPVGPASDQGEPWLIRRVAVSQVPSASAWLAIQRMALADRPAGGLLAWGDPAFDPQPPGTPPVAAAALRRVITARSATPDVGNVPRYRDLPALPETRDELLAIAKTLGADPARDLFLGAQATRESVLAANQSGELAQRRVIVFATHGLMAGDLPKLDQPALALTLTPDGDLDPLTPLLNLDDVLSLRLNADWVVLSACNTAAADGRAEEAMSGLARGFFYAGARSVLVTHWAVETESAKLLTTRTFEHYTANPYAGKAESLRQAMLSVMAMPKYRHPAFWAPYVLVGDGAR